MNLVDRKDMRVIYMTTGVMYVAELVSNSDDIVIKNAIAFAPSPKGMAVFTAFVFTKLSEEVVVNRSSVIAVTQVGDEVVANQYLEALKQAKNQQTGLVLP